MAQINKKNVIKRGKITTVTGNAGNTPISKRIPGQTRPQPYQKERILP